MTLFKKLWPWVFGIALSLTFWSPTLDSKWGLTDDHEVISLLGPTKKVNFGDIPKIVLTKTEVGRFGLALRYRPAYFLLRTTECALWGDHPGRWYACRIGIFALFVALSCLFFSHWMTLGLASALTLAITSKDYWSGIFTGLGPAEGYGVLGLGLYSYSFLRIWTGSSRLLFWFFLTVGALICIGSKENFLFLLLPQSVLILRLFVDKKFSIAGILSWLMVTLAGVLIATSVILAVSHAGHDIYNKPVGLPGLSAVLLKQFHEPKLIHFCLIATLALLVAVYRLPRFKEMRTMAVNFALVQLGLFALYLSQAIFYRTGWPSISRYDFPGMIAPVVARFLLIWFLLEFPRRFKMISQRVVTGILIVFCLYTSRAGVGDHRIWSRVSKEGTGTFTSQMDALILAAKKEPAVPIVVRSHGNYLEPTYSVQEYLVNAGVSNPLFLQLDSVLANSALGSGNNFERELKEISIEGLKGYSPWNRFSEHDKCLSVSFGGPPAPQCANFGCLYGACPE